MNEIILGDCVEKMKELESSSYDIVLCDPPYDIGKDFGNNSDKMPFDYYVEWCRQWINECVRLLKPSGTLYIYGFDENLAHLSVILDRQNQRWLTWFYTNKVSPACKFWGRAHESIICYWKDKEHRIFNVDAVREPYTETFRTVYGKNNIVRKGTKGRFGEKKSSYTVNPLGALPRDVLKTDDVIEVGANAGGKGRAQRFFLDKISGKVYPNSEIKNFNEADIVQHPTQKPFELTERLLKACKPENGKLLVPFVGSGSECYVAKKLGIEYLGFEINEDYVKLAKGFLENV